MQSGGYHIDIVVQGFPGRSISHGGLGWSTVALLRGHGRVALIDTGSFGMRSLLIERLAQRGFAPTDVTDLLLTHSHYDHVVNWPLFGHARIVISAQELAWALAQPPGETLVPELYLRALKDWPSLRTIVDARRCCQR
jgi:N-acyl homoserine lactone hydrolase